MKRGWFLLLALSLGLNAGLLYVQLRDAGEPRRSDVMRMPPPPPGRPGERPPGRGPLGPGQRDLPSAEDLVNGHVDRMRHHLRIDREQEDAIREQLSSSMPKILRQRRAMEDARERLARVVEGPNLEMDEFRRLSQALHRAQTGLDSLVTEAMVTELRLLSPEQRRGYVAIMPGGGPGPPPREGRP